MTYYRVKTEYDQKPRIKDHRRASKRRLDGIYVANELYTPAELRKFYIPLDKAYDMFDEVMISKNRVYWFFGSRFEYGKGPVAG
jgi:hypothetical protein